LLLHYRVENSQYGNDVEQGKLYQWKHVFFNPYAQFILQYLKKLKATQKEFRLQHSVEDCILESLSKIGRKKVLGICNIKLNAVDFVHLMMCKWYSNLIQTSA
jgi:hypothetical protein